VIFGNAVRDPCRFDLAFRAREALGHRRFGNEEGTGHLAGPQSAEQAQGERHLRFRGERRVAAGEDEAKPVVLHWSHLLGHAGIFVARREHPRLVEQFPSTRLAAQAIDGAVAGGDRDPAARIGRQAGARPLAEGDGEGVLHGVLGDVDVTEHADQGGDGSAVLRAEHPADLGLVELRRGVEVGHALRPRMRAGTDGPRSGARRPRRSSTPTRAQRRGPRPR
jgi:hypothetical protein